MSSFLANIRKQEKKLEEHKEIIEDIDEDDIGKEVKIDVGEIRDLHTGDIFTGKIIIKDLVKLTSTNLDSMEE